MRPSVNDVKVLENKKLEIVFNNGETRVFDVSPYIRGDWFGMLEDSAYFSKVKSAGMTIVWPDGQDICPDELYENSVLI